jgi:hypothetical protein
MVSAQYILRFIDADREVRRRPLVGMNFLHEHAIRLSPIPQRARGLINFLVDRFVGLQCDVPRRGVALCVFTPSGKPAVKSAADSASSISKKVRTPIARQYDPRARRSRADTASL